MPPTRSRAAGLAVAASLALSAVAVAPAAAADSPEAAVNQLLDATTSGDYSAVDTLVCEEERAAVLAQLDPGEAMGLDVADLISLRIDEREVEVLSEDGAEATVRLTGVFSMDIGDADPEEVAMALLGSDAAEMSEDEIEFALPFMQMALAQTMELDEELTVVLEDGEWVVCGGLGEAPVDDVGFDDDFGVVTQVSTDGVCGLVLPEELSAAGQLTYDTSSGWDISNCTYSSSDFELYHSATVTVELDTDAQSNASMFGADQTLEVAGSPAFASADPNAPFFVQVGPDMLNISIFVQEPAPDGYDAQAQAQAVAEVFVPRIVESRELLIPPVLPFLCDLTFAVDFETATGLRLNGGNVSPDFCNFESQDNVYLNANASPGTIEELLMFYPDAQELTVAGLPALQLDDAFGDGSVEVRLDLPDERVLSLSVRPYSFDKPLQVPAMDVIEALAQHVLERQGE